MRSCLYEGWVRHRRLAPKPHAFRYRLLMVYLDLSEVEDAFRGRWLWGRHRGALVRFRRSDYLGDARVALDRAVRDRVERDTGTRPQGPIRVLTHLSWFGYCFNPVTFYYCFDLSGDYVTAIVAEITNTPWGERHTYVLDAAGDTRPAALRWCFDKAFHVSPFMPMTLRYDWRLAVPGRALTAHMDVADDRRKVFDATLLLRRREITTLALARALVVFPAMTVQVLAAIYWQALRLWCKGARFHPHPRVTQP